MRLPVFFRAGRDPRQQWREAYRKHRLQRTAGLKGLSDRDLQRSVQRGTASRFRAFWARLAAVIADWATRFLTLASRMGGRKR